MNKGKNTSLHLFPVLSGKCTLIPFHVLFHARETRVVPGTADRPRNWPALLNEAHFSFKLHVDAATAVVVTGDGDAAH